MFYWFLLALLATWRVTHLLAREAGPGHVFARLRSGLAHTFLGELLACFNCLSIWVALPFTFVVTRTPATFLVAWLALSGGAVLLERMTGDPLQVYAAEEKGP